MASTAPALPLFSVDQYHRMIRTGVLTEGDAVELIGGEIIHKGVAREDGEPVHYRFTPEQCLQMVEEGIVTEGEAFALAELGVPSDMPRNPAHDSAIDRIDDQLRPLVPAGWRIRTQSAVRVPGGEPEPDLAVVLGPAGRYDRHHPGPADIALLIEVSDTTLAYDRTIKLQAYARGGIPVYWIVNLVDGRVEVHTGPRVPRRGKAQYKNRKDYTPGQDVPVLVSGKPVGAVAVGSILPPG